MNSVFLAEYHATTVQQLSSCASAAGGVGQYKVVKNRLARLAVVLRTSPHHPAPQGPTGLVIARDEPVAVAKALQTFARTVPALAVKAGFVDGQVLGPEELKALADLPPRAVLRGQVVAAVQGPLTQLVGLLERVQRDLVYVLEQRGEQAASDS
jgi:large subunit ribosomal protein L10